MVCFRADGNAQVGSGHVMRCLSLADAVRERGHEPVFLCADSSVQPVIRRRGYQCIVLDSGYDRMEGELPALLPLLEKLSPEYTILDSYFVTAGYMRRLKKAACLVYIDDLCAFDYPADLVINYNLYAGSLVYPKNKGYLLGPDYAPLRKEFQGLGGRKVKERVEHILVSTGGADPRHTATTLLTYLRGHPPEDRVTYHMLVGGMNPDGEKIAQLAAGQPWVELHRQVTDMRGLMLQCDVAVSAAGSTLYELCACGLPAVTYVLADNQIQGAQAFEAAGLMLCAGDVRTEPQFAKNVFARLERLSGDWAARQRMARRMQALVDGRGAARTVQAIGAALA